MRISDWSSDVCSSDLVGTHAAVGLQRDDRLDAATPFGVVRQHDLRVVDAILCARWPHPFFHPSRQIAQRSEEHTSELQSLMRISYAVFCLKKKRNYTKNIDIKHVVK